MLLVLTGTTAFSQTDKKEVRKGNRSFRKGEYAEADISYRKALLKDSTSIAANYNLANNLYRQEQFDEAGKYLEKIKETAPATKYGADYFYNLGDVALQKKDYQSAVMAFGQSLLLRPDDMDAKENYIYAKLMMKNQGGGGQDQNQDQNQDQQQDQNQDQQQNQDQNQDQQNQDQNQNKDQQDQQQNQQPKPQPSGGQEISPQQAQQMLEAIQNMEKETQDKVKKEKAAALKSRQKEKNW